MVARQYHLSTYKSKESIAMYAILKKRLEQFPSLYLAAQRIYPFIAVIPALLTGRRGSIDYLRSTLALRRRSPLVYGRPVNITIEPTNFCNLRCPVCETGSGKLDRPIRHMSLAEFKIIVDKVASHTNTLMLYFMGESFLNTDVYLMIHYAKGKGIPFVTTCTNGEHIDPEALVTSGLNEISFQISGITDATHKKYRVGSDLSRVLNNLRATVKRRNEFHASLHIRCGFILMRHNEHEVIKFQDLMREIGVDEAAVIDPCVRTLEQACEMLPSDRSHWYYDPEAFDKGILMPRKVPENECPWLYYSLTVQVNGDVVPCCRDATGKLVLGNLLEQKLMDIWNGSRYVNFRAAVLGNQKGMELCRLCSGYGACNLK
jgi:radical SAM protein with 4Fe4S-binding SPASM domain